MTQDIQSGDHVEMETRRDDGLLYMDQGVILYKIDRGTFAVLDDDEYYCVQFDNDKVIDCPARVLRLVRPLRVHRP
ncbi:MAG: hypothetical protein KHX31_06410 [Akkermansia sp.]|nr:hypothetical protein [Akkermansia sp.]